MEAGVEAGCLILHTESSGSYLLLGGDRTVLVVGRRITVRGIPRPNLATTCQQGIPFEVHETTSS